MIAKDLEPGMGQAVGERTVLRYELTKAEVDNLPDRTSIDINPAERPEFYNKWNAAALSYGLKVNITPDAPMRGRAPNVVFERWRDVASRVAAGNTALMPKSLDDHYESEKDNLYEHIASARLLMSGRHLQHGDGKQPSRNMEVFTNCATGAAAFISKYLLLNGAGVGTSFDDAMCLVDWDNAPELRCVLSENHPDFDYSAHESVRDAKHKYGSGRDVIWFEVPDTREGWAKALEKFEVMTFEKIHSRKMLILDWSKVREKGAPIKGMQNRPSSGPVPTMNALLKIASLKGAQLPKWLQAMYAHHYAAECVLVGGARRAARMSTKHWTDKTIFDFIAVKRPIEYGGLTLPEVIEYRQSLSFPPEAFLWSSNNSVVVDDEFWNLVALKRGDSGFDSDLARHARKVYKQVTEYSYGDGTGEPGFINGHKLSTNNVDIDRVVKDGFFGSDRYRPDADTELYLRQLARAALNRPYQYITNPCGEIVLHLLGGFCVIADVVPFHADTLDQAEDAFRAATRALMRVNLMDSVYSKEVKRTNRIGVGMTGVHEFAWKFFKFGFRDLIDEEKSKKFWMALHRFGRAVEDEAKLYAEILGVNVPHTMLTIKPAGTTSKLFGLTEGWHLPSMAWYMRWVQFRNDDPLVEKYRAEGYPVRQLKTYEGTTIIGFPTQPVLASMVPFDQLVTAGNAGPEEQYQWLQLGEKYYIDGTVGERVGSTLGNQISYTLKYDPERVTYKEFSTMLKRYQPTIKCCSVMPQTKDVAFEYQPEEPLTKAEYEAHRTAISGQRTEEVDRVHIACDSGACPVDFNKEE